MKIIFNSMLLACIVIIAACNGSNGSHHDHDGHRHSTSNEDVPVITASMEADSLFLEHIDMIAHLYVHIQTALADDDVEEAQSRSKQLVDHMNGFETSILTENEQQLYTRYGIQIKELSGVIMATKDIEGQRVQFENLSDVVYQLVKKVGVSAPLYKSYCPMAFDGKGAMWLSETEDIANPYYGSSMYSCGSVEEVIKR